jgi:hypothetical protein
LFMSNGSSSSTFSTLKPTNATVKRCRADEDATVNPRMDEMISGSGELFEGSDDYSYYCAHL